MRIAYGRYTQNFFTQSISKFFAWLMFKDFISKSMTENVGESALFFVEFHNDIEDLCKESIEDFLVTQNGGKYNLLNVESIVIEKPKKVPYGTDYLSQVIYILLNLHLQKVKRINCNILYSMQKRRTMTKR